MRKIKKLHLNRETVRELSSVELTGVAGAGPIPSRVVPCEFSAGGTCRVTFCNCSVGCPTWGCPTDGCPTDIGCDTNEIFGC